jgi:hypothetical protein
LNEYKNEIQTLKKNINDKDQILKDVLLNVEKIKIELDQKDKVLNEYKDKLEQDAQNVANNKGDQNEKNGFDVTIRDLKDERENQLLSD